MNYTIDRIITKTSFEKAEERTRKALESKGFGVLTEIDVSATMRKKLSEEMKPYKILGACNPQMAFKAISIEPRVGAMLPCNVILREVEGGIEVSAIDPIASMASIENIQLKSLAAEIRDRLAEAIEAI